MSLDTRAIVDAVDLRSGRLGRVLQADDAKARAYAAIGRTGWPPGRPHLERSPPQVSDENGALAASPSPRHPACGVM